MKLFACPWSKKLNRIYHIITISFCILLFNSPILIAEVIDPNKRYFGGSLVEYPNHGVSFILPNNVYGLASPESPQTEFVALVADFDQAGDNGIYIQLGKGDLEQVADQMTRPISFKGTQLNPVATPQKVDGAVYNDFEYDEEGKHYNAFMLMVMTSDNNAVIFVAASPESIFPSYKQAVVNIAQSIQFSDPSSQSSQTRQSTQNHNQAPSSTVAGNLSPELIGAWMRRTNASSGIYIESSSKWVFSGDGTVAWGSGTIIAGGTNGVSLRGGGGDPVYYGRWSTQGETLTIQWNNGTQEQRQFSVFDYDGRPAVALTANGETYYFKRID